MQVLVDTSIWVDHFRRTNVTLKGLLEDNRVLIHPFIVGEIACGSLGNREEILDLLQLLPMCKQADFYEILSLISSKKLYGKGVGFVDVHLAAASLLSPCFLWTADKRLHAIATELRIQFNN
jgi:predicted nucleic acid-binding protein